MLGFAQPYSTAAARATVATLLLFLAAALMELPGVCVGEQSNFVYKLECRHSLCLFIPTLRMGKVRHRDLN